MNALILAALGGGAWYYWTHRTEDIHGTIDGKTITFTGSKVESRMPANEKQNLANYLVAIGDLISRGQQTQVLVENILYFADAYEKNGYPVAARTLRQVGNEIAGGRMPTVFTHQRIDAAAA